MRTKEKDYNREKTVNKFVLVIITIIDSFLFFGYMSDHLQGRISFTFAFMVDFAVLVSLILSYAVYLKKRDSKYFKHVSVIGYMAVYALVLLGAQNDLVFAAVFPLTVIYILYFDYNLILRIAIVFSAINIVDLTNLLLVKKQMHSGNAIDSSSVLLQGATVIVYLIVLCGTTKISNKNNSMKISGLKEEQEKSAQMLEDILKVIEVVKQNSANAEEYIKVLHQNVSSTELALDDIAQGNSNNASSIEQQTIMTGNIQSMILETKQMSDVMLELAEQSGDAVNGGQKSVDDLQRQSQRTKEANEKVVSSVTQLIQNAKDVEAITEQIFAISSQTNLLALNASIESARAGEAGRGFAVVAEEIRVLADETRKLTEEIQKIVTELRQNADIAKNTVDNVMEAASAERELIHDTEERFSGIGSRMAGLNENVQEIYRKIEEILTSNQVIVDSINQISAVSQEVFASTQQAVELGEDTGQQAEKVKECMDELKHTVTSIDKYIQ